MACPQCGHQNKIGARFCARCGKPLGAFSSQSAAIASPAGTVMCKRCAALNRVGARFCGRCGKDLSPSSSTRLSQKNLLQQYRDQRGDVDILNDPLAMFILAYTQHVGHISPKDLARDLGLTTDVLNSKLNRLMQSKMLTQGAGGVSVLPQGTGILSEAGLTPPVKPPTISPRSTQVSSTSQSGQPSVTPPTTPPPFVQPPLHQQSMQQPPPPRSRPAPAGSGMPRWILPLIILGVLVVIAISVGGTYIFLSNGTSTPTLIAGVSTTPSTTATIAITQTPSPTAIADTPTVTPSLSPTPTPTVTESPPPTFTPTLVPTPTPPPPTSTPTATSSRTPTFTPTATRTFTPTPTRTNTPFVANWSLCGSATVGYQASHYPNVAWIPGGSFLVGLDLDRYGTNAWDSPIIGHALYCQVAGAENNGWSTSSWRGVESAGRNSHAADDPPWCPIGTFITQIDLNADYSISANDSPIIWQVRCASLSGFGNWSAVTWVGVEQKGINSHQPGYWCPSGSFIIQIDLDGAPTDDLDAPVIGAVRCAKPSP